MKAISLFGKLGSISISKYANSSLVGEGLFLITGTTKRCDQKVFEQVETDLFNKIGRKIKSVDREVLTIRCYSRDEMVRLRNY